MENPLEITQKKQFSVVIPVFNEADNLYPLYTKLTDILGGCNKQYELIFVNDGSSDGSLSVLQGIARVDSVVKVLSFDSNYGQTTALDAGFKRAKGRIVLSIDADLQYDPADLIRIIAELDSANIDFVLGKRVNRTSGPLKRISSCIANFVRNLVLKESFQDCSLAGYKKECLNNLKLYKGLQNFIPALLRSEGYRYKEIRVREFSRKNGKSTYNIRNRLFKGIFALWVVKWLKDNKLNYKIMEIIND